MLEALYRYLRTAVGLPETEWAFAAPLVPLVSLAKHEPLVTAGQVCRRIAFVETGVLRSFHAIDEREINNEFFLPGSFASVFTSFITRAPSAWTVQALEPCLMAMDGSAT